jgi:hypothetical protein
MGYFSYAYVVEGSADDQGVTLSTSIYAEHLDHPVFFSWAEGSRSPGLHSYADGTLYSDTKLSQVPGYPRTERRGNGPGEDSNLVLIEESFTPREASEPVLFHFVLPSHFVPRPDITPLVTPSAPSVIRRGDVLTATFVAKGGGDVRFWLSRLTNDETLDDYDLDRIFNAPISKNAKVTFELNLGIVKIAIGDR